MRKFIQTHLSFGERCAKELRSKHTTLFYEAFEVSKGFFRTFPLEKDVPKNFAQNTPLYFSEAFEVSKGFFRTFPLEKGVPKNFAQNVLLYILRSF